MKKFQRHSHVISTSLIPINNGGDGLNENTNGLMRQDFPKDTDFKAVKQSDVKRGVAKLNDRVRKSLAFEKPADLMAKDIAALAA